MTNFGGKTVKNAYRTLPSKHPPVFCMLNLHKLPTNKTPKANNQLYMKMLDPKSQLACKTGGYYFMLICTYIALPVCIPLPFKFVFFCLF